jgi:hypothetical protein
MCAVWTLNICALFVVTNKLVPTTCAFFRRRFTCYFVCNSISLLHLSEVLFMVTNKLVLTTCAFSVSLIYLS